MKIYRHKRTVPFGELEEGDVFKNGNFHYMKTEEVTRGGTNRNAVNLENGGHAVFMDGEHVIPVNGAFVEDYEEGKVSE